MKPLLLRSVGEIALRFLKGWITQIKTETWASEYPIPFIFIRAFTIWQAIALQMLAEYLSPLQRTRMKNGCAQGSNCDLGERGQKHLWNLRNYVRGKISHELNVIYYTSKPQIFPKFPNEENTPCQKNVFLDTVCRDCMGVGCPIARYKK